MDRDDPLGFDDENQLEGLDDENQLDSDGDNQSSDDPVAWDPNNQRQADQGGSRVSPEWDSWDADQGWPDHVLPRITEDVPARICDHPVVVACQCLQVPVVLPALDPFASWIRCFECFNPVVDLSNLTRQGKWKFFAYKLHQRWDRKYWSGFPSARVQWWAPWWEIYASYKYSRPVRRRVRA